MHTAKQLEGVLDSVHDARQRHPVSLCRDGSDAGSLQVNDEAPLGFSLFHFCEEDKLGQHWGAAEPLAALLQSCRRCQPTTSGVRFDLLNSFVVQVRGHIRHVVADGSGSGGRALECGRPLSSAYVPCARDLPVCRQCTAALLKTAAADRRA